MRRFYIQNEYGEKIELQGGSIFLSGLAGLGFFDDVEYMEADGFFIETRRESGQTEKTGTLVFLPTRAYTGYWEFANWIFAAERLTLAYSADGDWYFCDVDITDMEKTELGIGGVLEVPVTFMPLSPWYTPYDLNLTMEGEGLQGIKCYSYTYPYRYSNSARAGVLDFSVTAQMPCDFQLTLPGSVQNPILTATRLDTGEVIGRVDLSNVSAAAGETIVFSTVPREAGAVLKTPQGETDLTAQLGIRAGIPTFFRIPTEIPMEFSLTATSLLGVTAGLRIYRYYRTV